jgi:uncharacterized membrane protein SpoIIM required for sporulation
VTVAEFIKRRREDWVELERMLSGTPSGRRLRTSPEGASRFASHFRSACSDLARARAAGYPEDLIDYLNSLTARCHNLYYVAPPFPLGRIWLFFRTLFPLAIRRNAVYVVAGLLLFYGPMAGMIGLSFVDDQVLYQIVPKSMLEGVEKMYQKGHAKGRGETDDVMMTGFYVKNNVGIAFQCFAAGIFFGIGSIFVILFNGIMIGAIVGFVAKTPSSMNLLSFIVGHGPFELTAICISGAAGLRLGFGAVITGNRRRIDSLQLAGKDAILLVLGAAAMLLIAALIEGFFSPSSLPMEVKFGFGGATALFLIWYLGIHSALTYRRWRREQAEADAEAEGSTEAQQP